MGKKKNEQKKNKYSKEIEEYDKKIMEKKVTVEKLEKEANKKESFSMKEILSEVSSPEDLIGELRLNRRKVAFLDLDLREQKAIQLLRKKNEIKEFQKEIKEAVKKQEWEDVKKITDNFKEDYKEEGEQLEKELKDYLPQNY